MTNIIEELNKRFGDIMPLSISRGEVHDYLGMAFDYTTKGKLMITMYDYIDGIIKMQIRYTRMVQDQQHQPLITYMRFVTLIQRIMNHYLRMKENNIIPSQHNIYT